MILSDYETAFRVLEKFCEILYYVCDYCLLLFDFFFDMISPSFCLCVVIARS